MEAVAIHGGKSQEERDLAIRAFKEGRKDGMQSTLFLSAVAAGWVERRPLPSLRCYQPVCFVHCAVLVATDVASKGLDFPHIQHVINFDMPGDIETYVHRIGRTGRCGKTGIATTFINRSVPESTLLDLKHLLREARQRLPPALDAITSGMEKFLTMGGTKGCSYCGGPGHRITECPKRESLQKKQTMSVGKTDYLAQGTADY